MKKTFLFLLTVMLAFGMTLVSCGGDDDEGPGITTQSYTITNTEDGDVVQGFGDGKLYTKIPYTIYTFKDGHKEVSFNYDPTDSVYGVDAPEKTSAGVVAWVKLPGSYDGVIRITLSSQMKFTGADQGGLAWGLNTSGWPKVAGEGTGKSSNTGTAGKDAYVDRNGTIDADITGLTTDNRILYIDFGWDSTANAADKTAKKYYVKDLNIDIKKIIAGAPLVIQDFEALEDASSFKSADYGNGVTEDNTNLATLSLETDFTKYAKAVWANWGSGIVVPVNLGTTTLSDYTNITFRLKIQENWKPLAISAATADNVASIQTAIDSLPDDNIITGAKTDSTIQASPDSETWGTVNLPLNENLGDLTGSIYLTFSTNAGSDNYFCIDDISLVGLTAGDLTNEEWAYPPEPEEPAEE